MRTATIPEIMQILTGVFREILDEPSLVLREDLTADGVESWDSLNHIDLIVAVERRFCVKFTTREVASLKNVGDLAALTQMKLSARR
jgi:acyl carrier protein